MVALPSTRHCRPRDRSPLPEGRWARSSKWAAVIAMLLATLVLACKRDGGGVTLLHVSYEPTYALYEEYNRAFCAHYKARTGVDVEIHMSHGGSGKQARSLMDGLEADVATLALAYDVDMLRTKAQLVAEGWQKRLPDNASPFTSTIVFVVRRGNPKQIRDWDDLVRDGVSVITPNPKTSGGARWNYLAAWGYARRQAGATDATAQSFVARLFQNVLTLDPGARVATTTFSQRHLGDVLIAWENDALFLTKSKGGAQFELIVPSISILAEPSVSVVDAVASKRGTFEVATEYLSYLYSDEGQEIAAKHYYRPRSTAIATKYSRFFPEIDMFTVDEMFGGWTSAHDQHFRDGGVFDHIGQHH